MRHVFERRNEAGISETLCTRRGASNDHSGTKVGDHQRRKPRPAGAVPDLFSALLDALGLDAVVVVSRGGGDTDMSMDVLWLTNHYSAYGAYPDTPYMGTARAHGLFIMAKGRPSVLISDVS